MRTPLAPALAVLTAACAGGTVRFTPGDVEFSAPSGSAGPHVAATPDGGALLSWLEPADNDSFALRVARRSAGRWSEPMTVRAGDEFFVNWADFPSVTELGEGTLIAHWLERAGRGTYAYHVKAAISTDGGASWSGPITPHRDGSLTEHGFVSVVPWNGGAMALWLDGRDMTGGEHDPNGAMSIRATTIGPGGALGEEAVLDARTCECCQTALAATASGLVAAYRDRSGEEIRDIAVVRYVDGRWTEPAHVAEDRFHYPGCPVNGPQLATRGDTVAIGWYTAPDEVQQVKVAFSTDGGATFGPPVRVDEGDPLGRVDLVMLADGSAVVIWVERTETQAEIRGRRVERSGRADPSWLITTTSEARASGFPRAAIAGDEIVVAWTAVGDSGGVRVRPIRVLSD